MSRVVMASWVDLRADGSKVLRSVLVNEPALTAENGLPRGSWDGPDPIVQFLSREGVFLCGEVVVFVWTDGAPSGSVGVLGPNTEAKSTAEWRREWFKSRIDAAEGLLGLSNPDLNVKDPGVEVASRV